MWILVDDGCCLLVFFIFIAGFVVVVVMEQFVEQDGWSCCVGGLLEWLDFALFLSVLFLAMRTSVLSYPFINIIQTMTIQ